MEQTHIVRVHRPELTAAEREKRMEAIKKAAADLVVAARIIHSKEATP